MDAAGALSRALPGVLVSSRAQDRVAYARDLWPRRLIALRAGTDLGTQPAAVAWPRTSEEVSALVRFARNEGMPVVPFGAGSGVCGGVSPDDRTLVLDLKRLSDWRIQRDAPLLEVGAGALGITLEESLAGDGYTIGHFPSSILCSTVGGWIAARGAGQCSGKYGKIEDMVVALECVLGSGDIVRLRRRRSGPNMLPLLIGSEGTLGVVTRAELRLHPAPVARAFAAFSFPDIVSGWSALRELFQQGLRPAVSRLYDPIDSFLLKKGAVKPERSAARPAPSSPRRQPQRDVLRSLLRAPGALNAAIEAAEGRLLGGATLVLVFEGAASEVHADCERAAGICRGGRGKSLGEGPARAWYQHRYSVSYRQSPIFRMGAFSDTFEVAAPWSSLQGVYDAVRRALGRHVLVLAHLSHAYPDGCSIYFTFAGAARDDASAERVYDSAWRDALGAAIAAGATLSHHHGVGRSKAPRLGEELGFGVELVRRMKRAWDPDGILNPGNLLPRESSAAQKPPLRPTDSKNTELDSVSELVSVAGTTRLSDLQTLLERHGLTLGLGEETGLGHSVAEFVAAGLPGTRDPWSDPVAQTLSGLDARLLTGERLSLRPAPRRAVGPDLIALFAGTRQAIGVVERAVFSVERREATRARALDFNVDRDPPHDERERSAWESLVRSIRDI